MALQSDHSSSPDKIVQQDLLWDDTGISIDATHTINLGPYKDVEIESKKTYTPSDPDWDLINNEFNLQANQGDHITVVRYNEIGGRNDKDHAEIFLTKDRPYGLSNRTHRVVATFTSTGGTVSTAKGVAL